MLARFLLPRPSRDVTEKCMSKEIDAEISTPTPLAGRDIIHIPIIRGKLISTPTPLAGRDKRGTVVAIVPPDFYSHAPRGT